MSNWQARGIRPICLGFLSKKNEERIKTNTLTGGKVIGKNDPPTAQILRQIGKFEMIQSVFRYSVGAG
jgi:hypothetical protein